MAIAVMHYLPSLAFSCTEVVENQEQVAIKKVFQDKRYAPSDGGASRSGVSLQRSCAGHTSRSLGCATGVFAAVSMGPVPDRVGAQCIGNFRKIEVDKYTMLPASRLT